MRDSAIGLAPNMLPDVVESFGGYMLYGGLASKNNGIVKKVYGWQREVQVDPIDFDMETAGVANWYAYGVGTTIAKDSGAFMGTQCLKCVTVNPAPGSFGAMPFGASIAGYTKIGCVYATSCAVKTDGIKNVELWGYGTNIDVTFTSTNWTLGVSEGADVYGYVRPYWKTVGSGGATFWVDQVQHVNLSLNKIDFLVSPISNPIIQSTYVNQPWHTTVNGINAINYGSAITNRRTTAFTTPITQTTNQTVYMVVNKKISSANSKVILNRTTAANPAIYFDGGGTDKAYIYSNTGYRCESACAVGVRLIRYRNTTTSIGLKVDSVAEATYSAVAPVLGTWTGPGTNQADQGPCLDLLALIIINQDLPTTYPALDLYIRQSLARLCNCTAGVPVT